jgi:hypothetical protein
MLKSSIMSEYVVLNLVLNSFQYRFSISTKSANQETLNQVQGDKQELIQQASVVRPTLLSISSEAVIPAPYQVRGKLQRESSPEILDSWSSPE